MHALKCQLPKRLQHGIDSPNEVVFFGGARWYLVASPKVESIESTHKHSKIRCTGFQLSIWLVDVERGHLRRNCIFQFFFPGAVRFAKSGRPDAEKSVARELRIDKPLVDYTPSDSHGSSQKAPVNETQSSKEILEASMLACRRVILWMNKHLHCW